MDSNKSKKNQNTSKDKDIIEKERRSFLKKAAYSAPTLVTLGYLSRPTSVFAESGPIGTPCSDDPFDNLPPCN